MNLKKQPAKAPYAKYAKLIQAVLDAMKNDDRYPIQREFRRMVNNAAKYSQNKKINQQEKTDYGDYALSLLLMHDYLVEQGRFERWPEAAKYYRDLGWELSPRFEAGHWYGLVEKTFLFQQLTMERFFQAREAVLPTPPNLRTNLWGPRPLDGLPLTMSFRQHQKLGEQLIAALYQTQPCLLG